MCHSPRVIRCSRLLISFRNSILMARTEYKPAHSTTRLWPTCSVRALCVWTAASAKVAPQSFFFLFILVTEIALTSLHDSWAERGLDYLVCCVDRNTSHVTVSLAQRTCFMMCDTPHWLKCLHERTTSSTWSSTLCGCPFFDSLFLALFLSVCLSYPLLFSFHFYLDPDRNLFLHVVVAKAVIHWHSTN